VSSTRVTTVGEKRGPVSVVRAADTGLAKFHLRVQEPSVDYWYREDYSMGITGCPTPPESLYCPQ
jgi:hypothetical protein